MVFSLPDGTSLKPDSILSGGPPEYPYISDGVTEQNYFISPAESAHSEVAPHIVGCPPPTHWQATSSTTVLGTTFYPVSPIYGPSVVSQTITLTTDRTVTKGVEIQGGFGWSVGLLEAQAHVKLDGSVTTAMGQSITFQVAKGMSVHVIARIVYRQTELTRTNFAGPNCQGSTQNLTVLTPIDSNLIVGRAP
jgi:hypothetical protein